MSSVYDFNYYTSTAIATATPMHEQVFDSALSVVEIPC
jgi:hypothetical protein